jgi:D-alanyl-D-alanine dipeptidase
MQPENTDGRSYWAGQLDEAHAFMMRVMECPVAECGEPLASLVDAAREAGVEAVFSKRPHVHGLPRRYVFREGQIARFIDAADRLNRRGWVMRVEDGYRDLATQKSLGLQPFVFDSVLRAVTWELGGRTPDPAFLFKRLLTLVAQIPATGTHMTGSAVDISVLDRKTGEEVDRGAPYLEISEHTPMDSPFVSLQGRHNRHAITAIMRESGFVEYPYEFWHYSVGDVYEQCLRRTGRPARYGAVGFDAATGRVTPIENPRKPLNSLEEIRAEIRAALDRGQRNPVSSQNLNPPFQPPDKTLQSSAEGV